MHTFIDDKGIHWQEFTCTYTHELDNSKMGFTIWAVDQADAMERLKYIGSNGVVDGALGGVIDANGVMK